MSASVADDMIRSYFDRWQRLEEEKRTISDDLKEMFAEARGNGLDTKALRAVFREQVGDKAALQEFDAICDLYRASLNALRAGRARESQSYAEAKGRDSVEARQKFIDQSGGIGAALSAVLGVEVEMVRADPVTGEITDTQKQPETADETHKAYLEAVPQDEASLAGTGSRMLAGREGRSEGEAVSADLPTHSNPQPSSSPEADKPEAVSPPAVSGVLSADDVPAFIKRDYVLRPHCLNPSLCAGSGREHCHRCKRAMAESEAA